MTIRWLPPAAEKLDIIYLFYYRQQPSYAQKLYEQIIKDINLLIRFPHLAPLEPLLEKKPRKFRSLLIYRKIKIIYYIKNETIYIADIWDCRQNPNKLIKNLL